jgi:ribosomal protein S18 acetylase RimI-like enzyme
MPVYTMIRKAVETDIESIIAIDSIAQRELARRHFIRRSVLEENCYVHLAENGAFPAKVVGYGVLTYTFYDFGMIDMVKIAEDQQRKGFGSALMHHMESICRTDKLFTSTNESNAPMQAMLAKLGYQPSGVIFNLDPGDPELVFFKQIR